MPVFPRRAFLKRAWPSDSRRAMEQPATSLREKRLEQGLRLTDVAKRAGCSISLVSMTESGYRPGTQVRSAIARAVGASMGTFWPPGAP